MYEPKTNKPRRIKKEKKELSRREFLRTTTTAIVGAGGISVLPDFLLIADASKSIPSAKGYLLVDNKKCQGCMSCMLACSLVHEGTENFSRSRIQIIQNSFEKFPQDISIAQCRQCVHPACMESCPSGALHVDSAHGNIRKVDPKKCIACMSCIEACPFEPSRVIWDHSKNHTEVCDFCGNTPFWKEAGGVNGKQACVEVCPLKAIQVTNKIPIQEGDKGYNVNLRGKGWRLIGYPIK